MSLETADEIYRWLLGAGLFGGIVALWFASKKRELARAARALRPHGSTAHNASVAALIVGGLSVVASLLMLILGGKPLVTAAMIALSAGGAIALCASYFVGLTSESRRAAERRRSGAAWRKKRRRRRPSGPSGGKRGRGVV